MARDGYRIFDSDTHVGPDARILDCPLFLSISHILLSFVTSVQVT